MLQWCKQVFVKKTDRNRKTRYCNKRLPVLASCFPALWWNRRCLALTFKGEGLVEAPGGLLQLCVLVGGQLWGSGGQQVGVGIWLDGGQRRIMGISLALLYWQEGATGFGTGHFDSPLVARVGAASGWGSQGRLGGESVVEQLLVWCDWLPVVGLGLLSLQLLLFAPHVVQQDLVIPASSSSSSSSPHPCTLGESIICPCPSVCQRLRAPECSCGVCSSGSQQTVYPQPTLLCPPLILWGVDAVQEAIWAVTVTKCINPDPRLCRCSWISGAGWGGGVLRAREGRGRMEGEWWGMGGRQGEGPVGLKSLWMVSPERGSTVRDIDRMISVYVRTFTDSWQGKLVVSYQLANS